MLRSSFRLPSIYSTPSTLVSSLSCTSSPVSNIWNNSISSYPSWYPSHTYFSTLSSNHHSKFRLPSSRQIPQQLHQNSFISPKSLYTIPSRNASRFFDRLIPEDDPKTKEFKERERRVIKEQFARGKLADAIKARTEKVSKCIYLYRGSLVDSDELEYRIKILLISYI